MELLSELDPVHARWYMIGIQLDIPYPMLEIIKCDYHNDPLHAMQEMLKYWFHNSLRPTWEAVVTALKSPTVNEKDIAAHLESKYCKPVKYMLGELLYEIDRSTWFVTYSQMQRHLWFPRGPNAIVPEGYDNQANSFLCCSNQITSNRLAKIEFPWCFPFFFYSRHYAWEWDWKVLPVNK